MILDMIEGNCDCDVMFLPGANDVFSVKRGAGLSNYIVDAKNISGITGMVICNDVIKKLTIKKSFYILI
ncbi:MAG: hypothetical protein ACREVX_16670 [Clostridium sp.]|uniref:hypothetical protein n=1 Tax=Clostridium sp. TaxID=1506 RepID=UPI003D6D9FFD